MDRIRETLWRWAIVRLRLIVDGMDEWIHAQEVQIREKTCSSDNPRVDPLYDRAESSRRESKIRRARKTKLPRLRYDRGAWVRP
jgi:hypothetical protein